MLVWGLPFPYAWWNDLVDKWNQKVGCGSCYIFVTGPSGKHYTAEQMDEIVTSVAGDDIDRPTDIDLPEYLVEVSMLLS